MFVRLTQRVGSWLAQNAVPLGVLIFLVGCSLVTSWIRRPESERTGTIRVETTPPGAEASLDGRLQGATPLTIVEVTYGEHVLRFEKHGFEPTSQAVTVSRKEEAIQVTLRKRAETVELTVVSNPTGAAVRLDGESVGWTPVTLEGLAPGSHDLSLRKDGYGTYRQRVKLVEGRASSMRVVLKSKTEAVLTARAEEKEASVRDCVELAHHHILNNEFDRAGPPLAKALEMTAGTGEKNRWVMEEIEKPYWGGYDYGGQEAVEACRRMLEGVLIAEVKARPSHEVARSLLVDLLRKAERWERLAEAMSEGIVPQEDASPRELGLYGEVMVRVGRGDEVFDVMSRTYRRNRDCWELTYAIALALQQEGEKVKARIKLKQALLHCPDAEGRQRIRTTLEGLSGD